MREIELPPGAQPAGEALTPNGQYLLVADGIGVAVVSVVRAERGLKHAVLGQLYAGAASNEAYNTAIEVAASPDGDFAFASLEGAQALGVFDLRKALATQFRSSGLVGSIPMNYAPVGMAISPDGRWLYATSEGKSLASARGGTLSVIDLHKAEKEPSHSVVTRVDAGCDPVRVIASPTNDVVWVAARESNSVLAFSSTKLRADPQHARLAEVRVGKAPVGLLLLRNGTRLLVADSNRFGQPFQHGELSVIDTTAALANKPALIGAIPAGSFPRDMSLSISQHRVLVSNFASNALEAIDVTGIP